MLNNHYGSYVNNEFTSFIEAWLNERKKREKLE
jgi:hypothetical protein